MSSTLDKFDGLWAKYLSVNLQSLSSNPELDVVISVLSFVHNWIICYIVKDLQMEGDWISMNYLCRKLNGAELDLRVSHRGAAKTLCEIDDRHILRGRTINKTANDRRFCFMF